MCVITDATALVITHTKLCFSSSVFLCRRFSLRAVMEYGVDFGRERVSSSLSICPEEVRKMPQGEQENPIGRLGVVILGKGEEQEVVSGKIVDTHTGSCDGVTYTRVGIKLDPSLPGGSVLYAARENVLVGE